MSVKLSTTSDADIILRQLLARTMQRTTLSFLETASVKAGGRVLCLNCGEGDIAFHLSGLVGDTGTVTGIDPNGENIHTAQQLTLIKNIRNATFYNTDWYEQGNGQQYELIHCRLSLTRFFDLETLLKKIEALLMPGGMVLFEVTDFSGFNSTPKNFAFERFLDLYTALLRSHWGDTPICTQLNQLLLQSGFQGVRHQYVAPSFLQTTSKQLSSLTLECIKEQVLSHKLISRDELEVLLYELKKFEQEAYSLISLPCIHQIRGYKA
jgi:ubiquinone/menaquinone biosynthesis C-methylase UbiE